MTMSKWNFHKYSATGIRIGAVDGDFGSFLVLNPDDCSWESSLQYEELDISEESDSEPPLSLGDFSQQRLILEPNFF